MTWRLTSEIITYIVIGKKEIYLAGPEKKSYQVEVQKLIGTEQSYHEIRLYENQFEIRLGGNENKIDVYVRASELPEPDEWYLVKNYWTPNLWELLESHNLKSGCFDDDLRFEVGFEESSPYVIFVEPGMPNFKRYFEEMKRRMNCELCKKTTKWIPGHRYDTISESIYYLASVKSRRKEQFNSEFGVKPEDMPEVIIYTNSIDKEKTISEVIRSNSFGEAESDLKIMYGKKAMVDAGKALVNDFSGDIQDYWADIYRNAVNLKDMLDTFSVISDGNIDTKKVPVESIKNTLKQELRKQIIEHWELKNMREDLEIYDKLGIPENSKRLCKLLVANIKDGNFLKNMYYPELFNNLGINLQEEAEDLLSDFTSLRLDKDFNVYLDYFDYWNNPGRIDQEKCQSRQRIKSTNYKLDVTTLKDLYGDTELKDTLIELANSVRENYGLGASEFSIINVGSRKDPKEYIICNITLQDLINYKKGIDNLSDEIKSDIMNYHFVHVQIIFDKDGELN